MYHTQRQKVSDLLDYCPEASGIPGGLPSPVWSWSCSLRQSLNSLGLGHCFSEGNETLTKVSSADPALLSSRGQVPSA